MKLDDIELPAAVIKRVKFEMADSIQDLLTKAADKVNQDLESCLGVPLLTPRPGAMPLIPAPFAIEEPRPYRSTYPFAANVKAYARHNRDSLAETKSHDYSLILLPGFFVV